jgi:hypothetical protein
MVFSAQKETGIMLSDLRLWAAVVAVLSAAAGAFFPISIVVAISVVVVGAVVGYLVYTRNEPTYGTSGALGMAMLLVGGAVAIVLPMWGGWLFSRF